MRSLMQLQMSIIQNHNFLARPILAEGLLVISLPFGNWLAEEQSRGPAGQSSQLAGSSWSQQDITVASQARLLDVFMESLRGPGTRGP